MFPRRVTIGIENRTGNAAFQFGGEFFDAGGWQDQRLESFGEHAQLQFENKVLLRGVSGYVYYHTPDRSRTLYLAFTCPIAGSSCFTARGGAHPPDCQGLWEQVPEAALPGAGLRRADGCAWETIENQDDGLVLRVVVLPEGGESAGRPSLEPELALRLSKAQDCRSALAETTAEAAAPTWNERQVLIEVDNRTEEAFHLDGEWFDPGRWLEGPTATIPRKGVDKAKNVVKLKFTSDELFRGVAGMVWFVNEPGLDTYFSLVFSNPIAGYGTFGAWAGPPPAELLAELPLAQAADHSKGVQAPAGRGVAWNVLDAGSTLHVRLAIIEDPVPMDPLAYPPGAARAEGEAGESRPSQAAGAPSAPTHAPAAPSSTTALVPVGRAGEDEDDGNLDSFINSTRPRDFFDGLGSGLKAAGAGTLGGLTALVAMPVVGAREEGVSGFVTGLGKGVVGAVAGVALGATACVTQVVRGAVNTPEALQQAQAGKRWDAEAGAWVDDSTDLRQESEQVAGWNSDDDADAEDGRAAGSSTRHVADTALYDTIGVASSASEAEIKRAYYKAALKCHPDKNPGDPEASKRFQELAQAYQVLSDAKLRERYDKEGKAAVSGDAVPSVDPTLFFRVLFGSEQFEKYIGKLSLAMQTDHLAKDLHRRDAPDDIQEVWNDPSHRKKNKLMKRQQMHREVTCAVQLVERLGLWVNGRDEAGFTAQVAQEASELVRLPLGGRLLRTIGGVYENYAEQFFMNLRGSFTIDSHLASWRDSTHAINVRVQAASSMARSAYAVKRMHDHVSAEPADDAEAKADLASQAELLNDSLPVFLQTIWDVSVMDIETTLWTVCDKVLKDISVPWQIRYRRALALRRLGRAFRDAGQAEHADLTDTNTARQHLEEALLSAIKEKK